MSPAGVCVDMINYTERIALLMRDVVARTPRLSSRSNACMRFLVDENLPSEVAFLLTENGHDALYVPATDLHRSTDAQLVDRARRENRLLVTKDVTLATGSGHLMPGVVLVQVPDWYRKANIIEVFRSFTRHPRFSEVEGKLTIVSQRRVTARRLPGA